MIKKGGAREWDTNRKGRASASSFADVVTLYMCEALKTPLKTLRVDKYLQQSSRIQMNTQKSVAFLYTNSVQRKKLEKHTGHDGTFLRSQRSGGGGRRTGNLRPALAAQ